MIDYMKDIYASIVILIAMLIIAIAINWPKDTYRDDPKVQEAIETYEKNHKDDWDGYKGYRRGSFAETQKLKSDGYDVQQYRDSHGYGFDEEAYKRKKRLEKLGIGY